MSDQNNLTTGNVVPDVVPKSNISNSSPTMTGIPDTSPISETVIRVQPKVRFVGNISNDTIVIPDLKNAVDESGLVLQPSQKIDLLLYYTPQEINRSRGLDNCINGIKDLKTEKEIQPPILKVLQSLEESIPPPAKSFVESHEKGSQFEAEPNYADDNLKRLDEEERKEEERIQAKNRHMR